MPVSRYPRLAQDDPAVFLLALKSWITPCRA